jgi:hypothetical protein
MKKGFNATTLVLVAVLVGALFMVGRTVTPPPPGPPEPPKTPKAQSGNQMVAKNAGMSPEARAHKMQELKEHALRGKKTMPKGSVKKFDPNQIEIVPGWTHDRLTGEVGNEAMEKKVEAAKAEEAAARAAGPLAIPSTIKPAK